MSLPSLSYTRLFFHRCRHSLSLRRMASSADTSVPLVQRIVAAAVSVADQAGEIIRDIMKKGELGVVEKTAINDLQTEADRKAQKCIINSLSKQFPDIHIIGEEGDTEMDSVIEVKGVNAEVMAATCPDQLRHVEPESVVVWVDPLDGTKEYTEGYLDHVTVLIGVAVGGAALAGVIHQPYYNYQAGQGASLGRTIWGMVGLGSFGFQYTPLPVDQRIVTTTRSHLTPTVESAIEAMGPTQVLRVGGAGHKVLILLEGRANAYLFASPGCKKWDTCAPEALLKAVGGKLTDIHGNDIEYHKGVKFPNSGGVLAAYRDHDWFLARVPDTVKKQLPP